MDAYNDLEKFSVGDYYLNSEGYKVFTAQYLLKRAYCCKNNCRHCPYGFDKKTNTLNKKAPQSEKKQEK